MIKKEMASIRKRKVIKCGKVFLKMKQKNSIRTTFSNSPDTLGVFY
jgi:hypothetical protein